MRSAYFDSSGAATLDNGVNFSDVLGAHSSGHGFPQASAPFWDRQCIGFATDLKASCAAPPIVLSSSDIHLILSSLAVCGQPAYAVQLTRTAGSTDNTMSYSTRSSYTLTSTVGSRLDRLTLSVPVSVDTCLPSNAGADWCVCSCAIASSLNSLHLNSRHYFNANLGH